MDNTFLIKLGLDNQKLVDGLNKSNGYMQKFANNVETGLKSLATGFAVTSIGKFALDVSKLAGEAEGVSAAFNKLPGSTQLMLDLKAATGGTVSELDLMKRAVMASNFDISLKALPNLLEFATVRAKQTGQSVNYLVDSIVTGIGRKSKLILDNLGISAVQLTEALGGASTAAASIGDVADAVGKIAETNLKQMGSLSENNSTKLERLAASWENVKVAIGNSANGTGVLGNILDGVISQFDVLASKNLDFWDKLGSFLSPAGMINAGTKNYIENLKKATEEERKYQLVVTQADQALLKANGDIEEALKIAYIWSNSQELIQEITKRAIEQDKKKATEIENINTLTEKLTFLQEDQKTLTIDQIAKTNIEISQIEKKIKALKELGTIQAENLKTKEFTGTIEGVGGDIAFSKNQNRVDASIKKNLTGSPDSKGMNKVISDSLEDSKKKAEELFNQMKDRLNEIANVATTVGDSIGEALVGAFSGDQSGIQQLKQGTIAIINMLEQRALAAIVASALISGANPIVALVAASAGFAAVKALFSRIGGTGGGGGGGGLSGASSTRDRLSSSKTDTLGQRIDLSGSFNIRGSDLVAVLSNQNRIDNRLKTTG